MELIKINTLLLCILVKVNSRSFALGKGLSHFVLVGRTFTLATFMSTAQISTQILAQTVDGTLYLTETTDGI